MKGQLAAACLLIAGATPAAAQNFSCSNQQAEIHCNAGTCEVNTEGFTPMSLSRSGNKLEVCAYTDCWAGPVLVRRSRGTIDLLYAQVRASRASGAGTGTGMNELAVVYDRGSRTAQMRWGGFANSMGCGAGR